MDAGCRSVSLRALALAALAVVAPPATVHATTRSGFVAADTYIEAGAQAAWVHGGAAHVDVDTAPAGVAYLRLDLSTVPERVLSAILQLYVTNASDDGGTVYAVPDTGWIEGTAKGIDAASASVPGLRWIDVDRNANGALDASDASPLVPAAGGVATLGPVTRGQTVRVDVTAALQAGARRYTLAIMNRSTNGATFASRETSTLAQRPILHLVVDDGGGDVTVPPPPATESCLSQTGPLTTLAAGLVRFQTSSLAAGARVDARAVTFLASPTNLYPINFAGAAGTCFAGGTVAGQYDRALSWKTMHSMNNAGVRFKNAGVVVEGVRIDNVSDGIRPVGGPFTIRDSWLSYVRDDCLENDHVHGGLIEDTLFDGCYVGISARPSQTIIDEGYDGRNQLLTLRGSLLRLEPMPDPDHATASGLGHGPFFKLHALAPKLALHDNVFMAQQKGGTMEIPPTASCSNNVMVWLGAGSYPAPLPACFTMTRDRGVWDRAVAAWKARHPRVGAR
jgi:hypothetical protein